MGRILKTARILETLRAIYGYPSSGVSDIAVSNVSDFVRGFSKLEQISTFPFLEVAFKNMSSLFLGICQGAGSLPVGIQIQ